MISLDYRDSKPIYEQVKDGFKKLIFTGAMIKGEKMPSVRELASALAVNPNTIQRAYRDLENEGFIFSVTGKGSFVAGLEKATDTHREELLSRFDATVKELLSNGIKKSEITERLKGVEL